MGISRRYSHPVIRCLGGEVSESRRIILMAPFLSRVASVICYSTCVAVLRDSVWNHRGKDKPSLCCTTSKGLRTEFKSTMTPLPNKEHLLANHLSKRTFFYFLKKASVLCSATYLCVSLELALTKTLKNITLASENYKPFHLFCYIVFLLFQNDF